MEQARFSRVGFELHRDIENRRKLGHRAVKKPIVLCRRPDSRMIIVDGNHRAAAALNLGLDVRAALLPPAEFLAKVVTVPGEFFGTKRLNRPYQSLFREGRELLKGRRRDG